LQSLWKVGIESEEHRVQVMQGLESRYFECATEKNCTLIRFEIIQDMRNLYDEIPDEQIKARALQLVEMEDDPNYQKKYAKLWKA
jgi:transcription elongation factor GreA-like protein